MSALDPKTQAWINSLKLNKSFKTTTDFENGYNFGVIFDKLQISRGKKFKNSSDLGCIFQNYKNVKDLLMENFGYDFPANNMIYRTEELLKVIRDQSIKYVEKKKAATLKAAASINNNSSSLIQPQEEKLFKTREKQIVMMTNTRLNQTAKMPKKIQDIEKKLDKYREEKTRHELLALEQRKQEIDQYRRLVQNTREYEIKKVKKLHDNTKDMEKKVYDVWSKTEQIKMNRIKVDQEFDRFQKQKKAKFASTLRKEETDFVDKGLEMFQLNCIRQGIELEHDPDKPVKPEGDFNRVVIMERIKDNIKKHESEKKQRIKRENKKRIDADEAKAKSQQLWKEIHKLEDYQAKFSQHFLMCEQTYIAEERFKAEKIQRKDNFKVRQFVDLPAYGDEETREEQFRQRKVQYLHEEADRVEKVYKYHYSMAEDIVEALLETTIVGEQIFVKNNGFTYQQWKEVEKIFLSFEGESPNKKGSKRGNKTEYFVDFATYNNILREYIKGLGSWRNYQHNRIEGEEDNEHFSNFISEAISKAYPDAALPESQGIPLYMPLKIAFQGSKASGKTSLSAKLGQKFGIPIIDVLELLTESIQLAKPPSEEDTKKGGKKDPKKVEEPSGDKIALKQFGEKLLELKITSVQDVNISHYIEIIKLRLKQIYPSKDQAAILQEYTDAKTKQQQRHQQALKQFEEGKNKPKKDSKKGAPVQEGQDEPPKPNPCFYANGFILDNFPFTLANIKLLQKQLNAFISEDERINKQAQEMKGKLSVVLSLPERVKDDQLKSGVFDLLGQLEVPHEQLQRRKEGRKIDPQTKIVYHPEFNPVPTDVKGFADKLTDIPTPTQEEMNKSIEQFSADKEAIANFYSYFGVEHGKIPAVIHLQGKTPLNETISSLQSFVEKILQSKYQVFEQQIQREAQEKQKQSKINNEDGPAKQQPENVIPQQPVSEQPNQIQGTQIAEQSGQNVDQQETKQKAEKQLINTENKQENVGALNGKATKTPDQLESGEWKSVIQKYAAGVEAYEDAVKQCLHNFEQERQKFGQELFAVQKYFTSIVNRPDDKAGKILGFQQNYNKLLIEQSSIVKDAEASKHLIFRLDQLYDSLWTAIGGKKNQAVEERIRFLESSWLSDQALRLVELSRRLLQTELDYICETIFCILTLLCKMQGKSSDYMTEYLSLGIAPELEPIQSISLQELTKSDRLEYYLNQVDRCLDSLPQWIEQKHKKMKVDRIEFTDQLLDNFVAFSIKDLGRKKENIRNKITERLLEQRSYYIALANKMDEWIIQGIKSQNDFVYEIYKNIKKSIEEARKANVKELHVREITEQFGPIRELTLYPIPLRVYTAHRSLPIFSYMVFLEETKTLAMFSSSANRTRIPFDILKKYLTKRKKSALLDPQILKIDFDTMEQYLVKDGILLFRELAIAVLLWDVKVFDDEALLNYRRKLLKEKPVPKAQTKKNEPEELQQPISKAEQGDMQNKQSSQNQEQPNKEQAEQRQEEEQKAEESILQVQPAQSLPNRRQSSISLTATSKKLSLEELVLMDGAFDEQEEYIMRHLIFQVFRQDGLDYVEAQVLLETLSVFDQLQLERYGDAVMMLGI